MEEINNIVLEGMRLQIDQLNKIIEDAFLKHFGFPIQEAEKGELKYLQTEGDPIVSFMYRGETFLYVENKPYDFDFKCESDNIVWTAFFNVRAV